MLYPYDDDTVESLLQRNSSKSQIIYLVVLFTIVAAGVAAYFIKVPVTVQAHGIIRPLTERTEITSTLSEIITSVHLSEGQTVEKGDTLLRLNSEKIEIAIKQNERELDKFKQFVGDLSQLLSLTSNKSLESTYYRSQYSSYQRRLFELETRLSTITKSYERSKLLFSSNTIAPAEMEKDEQEYLSMLSEVDLFKSEQRTKWEDELHRYTTSINELNASINQYNKDLRHYTILAPVSGTVEQFTGLYTGNYIIAGNTLAVISPNTSIQIECYVQPKDIGFINLGDTARVQVEAFPYTEWGFLRAVTKTVSDDYHLVNNTPMFRVRCLPEADFLCLKNGFTGKVKKGMRVQARFPVIERTLYQLLFDKVNDWLNPAQQNRSIEE